MAEEEEAGPLVIDNGSHCIKSGFAGDDVPRSMTAAMIAQSISGDDTKTNDHVHEASIKYAMEHGMVSSPEHMELLWYHVFKNELKVDPSKRRVLLTDSAQNAKSNKETITQIMFETFNVIGMHIGISMHTVHIINAFLPLPFHSMNIYTRTTENQSLLSIYASGRVSGIVLSVGDGVIETVPIWAGYPDSPALRRTNYAGREVTDYLMHLLNAKGYAFSTSVERQIVRDIKEKHGYIAMDYKAEIDKWESTVGQTKMEKKYLLPDGKEIKLNVERFKCGELLFDPQLFGVEEKGMHQVLYESISACGIDIRRDLYHNIVLAGGASLMTGFAERLKAELSVLMKKGGITGLPRAPKVVAPPERVYSAWIGGSILASLSTFNSSGWTTRKEYREHGTSVIFRKCRV